MSPAALQYGLQDQETYRMTERFVERAQWVRRFGRSRSVRLIIFASLMMYAATADFVATSFIAHGHDHDHPLLRIEHKCVTDSVKHHRSGDPAAPLTLISAVQIAATPAPEIVMETAGMLAADLPQPRAFPDALPSLRC
jgi:hypothetical protein